MFNSWIERIPGQSCSIVEGVLCPVRPDHIYIVSISAMYNMYICILDIKYTSNIHQIYMIC